jgi:hypothetical protein
MRSLTSCAPHAPTSHSQLEAGVLKVKRFGQRSLSTFGRVQRQLNEARSITAAAGTAKRSNGNWLISW